MCEENLRGSKRKLSVWKKQCSLWIEWSSELNVECKELLKMQKYEWILGVYVKKCSYEKVYWVYDKNKRLREIKSSMVKVPVWIKRRSTSLTA